MKSSRISGVLLAVLAAPAGLWAAGGGVQPSPRSLASISPGAAQNPGVMPELEGAVGNASGVMDGAARRSGLAVDLAADAGLSGEAGAGDAAKAAAQAKAGYEREQRDAASRARLDSGAVPAAAAPEQPKAGPAAGVAGFFKDAYKWMVRNPVETSFAVAIPVTYFFGATAGTWAGMAVYLFLQSRQKKPF